MSLLSNAIAIPQKGGYTFTDSVRLRSSASAYLNRTPTSAGNRKTWTLSTWMKRGSITNHILFNAGVTSTNFSGVQFTSSNQIEIFEFTGSYAFQLTTTSVYRDPSAWLHIVVAFDTTQATASNRIKLYVNGSQVTAFATASYPTLNTDYSINNTINHEIGRSAYNSTGLADCYLTEFNFVDGQQLTPSDFGESNVDTGVWQPKKYTGTYGTNGFYLPMNQETEFYSAEYLVVAGGGGGGKDRAGGGGAGGMRTGTTSIAAGTTYTITVGGGGAGSTAINVRGGNGASSSISGGISSCTGGGGGGTNGGAGGIQLPVEAGANGGSGGGARGGDGVNTNVGIGVSGEGNNGGPADSNDAGGGGGKGAAGTKPNGGNGAASSITGSSITYAGGGGGGITGVGGSGGGGNAALTGQAGTANLGGGGGGGTFGGSVGGNGGKGVVILRVPTANYSGTTTGSPTVTTTGSDTVIKFTGSGTYTA